VSNIVHPLRPLAKATPVTLPTVQALRMTLDCLGVSQAKLAKRIKSTPRTVGKWCSGESPVSIETLCNDSEVGLVFSARLSQVMSERVRRAA